MRAQRTEGVVVHGLGPGLQPLHASDEAIVATQGAVQHGVAQRRGAAQGAVQGAVVQRRGAAQGAVQHRVLQGRGATQRAPQDRVFQGRGGAVRDVHVDHNAGRHEGRQAHSSDCRGEREGGREREDGSIKALVHEMDDADVNIDVEICCDFE